jgi:hypothetical protein
MFECKVVEKEKVYECVGSWRNQGKYGCRKMQKVDGGCPSARPAKLERWEVSGDGGVAVVRKRGRAGGEEVQVEMEVEVEAGVEWDGTRCQRRPSQR